ncbi:hypothetical protein ACROYT_G039136 [Oculina patagonica]
MTTQNYLVRLIFLLASLSSNLFTVARSAEETPKWEKDIIKDCNGIQYRLMVDWGEPPFPKTACDVKEKVLECFEHKRNKGSGSLLDKDRFLLLQSAIIDKALMCPTLEYQKLQESIQNSAIAQELASKYQKAMQQRHEQCAVNIHRNCEKNIFDQVVVNHLRWPRTTKWRQCYEDAIKRKPCSAQILENYAKMQEEFGESLRQKEYEAGLYGIFMNDHNNQQSIEIL